MRNYSKNAVDNFKLGYNCAQSVFLAFADRYGFDENTALKLASSFGAGMGRLREVCGAVTAMFAIAGLEKGYSSPTDDDAKAKHYELIQQLAQKFKSKFNTIICSELLGLEKGADSPIPQKRTPQYYENRPCEEFIKYAAELIEREILK